MNTKLQAAPAYFAEPTSDGHIYGVLSYDSRYQKWVIKGEPAVIEVAKRLFPGSETRNRTAGTVRFAGNKRVIGDINWLMLRYPLDIRDKDLDRWQEQKEAALRWTIKRREIEHEIKPVTPPATFSGELRRFQQEGLSWLLHNERTLLADEMGLGKTPQALAWLASLDAWPSLIVVMPHLVRQWVSESKRFLRPQAPGQMNLLDEAPEQLVHVIKGLKPYELPPASVYIIHYLLLRGWKEQLPDFGFKAVVFDEIQELRHKGTEKYSAASLLAGAVPYVAGLSGTPIYNTGGEIWNVMNIVEYHCLGDWDSFTREWCDGYGNEEVKKPELLGEHLRREGLLLRRTKDQVLDELPPKRRYVQEIDVDNGLYGSLIGDAVSLAVQASDAETNFERGRLIQEAINETRRVTGIAKAKAVTAFVRALLEAGEPVILYAYHHDVWDIYRSELADLRPTMITGKQNPNEKTLAQVRFMGGETDLIMVSLRAAAGLNLQRAKVVVFGELDWSPAIHAQAEDRAHRMGQKDSVLCYYLVCDEGTDQDMLDALGLKVQQFIGIMGDKEETEQDRLIAESKAKEHMSKVVERLTRRAETGRKAS